MSVLASTGFAVHDETNHLHVADALDVGISSGCAVQLHQNMADEEVKCNSHLREIAMAVLV